MISILSCDKDHDFTPYVENVPENDAKLKFIHAAVGPNGTNFRINYYVNNEKVSGISSASSLVNGILYNSQYPIAPNYALITSGSQALKVLIPGTATVPDNPIIANTITTESGKNYSCFLTGTAPDYSIFKVNDDFSVLEVDKSKAYIRVLNLVTNTPVTGYDYIINKIITPALGSTPAVKEMIKTISGVAYKGVSDVFVPLNVVPELQNIAYEIQLRETGTTVILNTFAVERLFIPRPNRAYTIYSVGVSGGIPNTTTNLPTVNVYTNK